LPLIPTTVRKPARCCQTWIPYVRGDVYQLKAPRDARGHEQRSNRYAVVVQSDLLPLSTWLVAPTSTSARPTSFRPEIEILGKTTHVLVEQTAAVDPERLGDLVGHLTRHELAAVDDALRTVLHLE
jgi:mRNA interferase MazF